MCRLEARCDLKQFLSLSTHRQKLHRIGDFQSPGKGECASLARRSRVGRGGLLDGREAHVRLTGRWQELSNATARAGRAGSKSDGSPTEWAWRGEGSVARKCNLAHGAGWLNSGECASKSDVVV